MMYLGNLLVLLVLLWGCYIIGQFAINFTRFKQLADQTKLLAVPIGLSVLIVAVSIVGRFINFGTILVPIVSTFCILIMVFFTSERPTHIRNLVHLSILSILASPILFSQLIVADGFNPFNDAFTYLVHGQWLQTNIFSHQVNVTGNNPYLTQVSLYQTAGHRMGSSYLLAFIQSLFRSEWSYYVYPASIGLPIVAYGLACASIVATSLNKLNSDILNFAFIVVILPAGVLCGSQIGFYPQTFGLCMAASFLSLYILIVKSIKDNVINGKQLILINALASLPFSALVYAYNDMLVYLLLIVLFHIAYFYIKVANKKHILVSAAFLFGFTLLITNIELTRVAQNFISTVLGASTGKVMFGWPVDWHPLSFIWFSLGGKYTIGGNDIFNLYNTVIFGSAISLGVAIILKNKEFKIDQLTLGIILSGFLVSIVFFVKFRYFTVVDGSEHGHTFLQYKIAQWGSVIGGIIIAIISSAIILHYSYGSRLKYAFAYIVLVGYCIFIAFYNLKYIGPSLVNHFQEETRTNRTSFASLLTLRNQTSFIDRDQPIYLNFGSVHHKLAQMVMYVLYDRSLAGDYTVDGYITGQIPEKDRVMDPSNYKWSISRLSYSDTLKGNNTGNGTFVLNKLPDDGYNTKKVENVYGVETTGQNYWYWVADDIKFEFISLGSPKYISIKFDYLLLGESRTMDLDLICLENKSGVAKQLFHDSFNMKPSWDFYAKEKINVNGCRNLLLRVYASGDQIRLSQSDSRMAKYMIRNLVTY